MQTPFVSVNMYLNEAKDEKTKADLALIIEEVLKQRIVGTKNKDGVWVTPAFPKLLYVLEEDNVKEGSKYFYLTKLAAECTAKRMVHFESPHSESYVEDLLICWKPLRALSAN